MGQLLWDRFRDRYHGCLKGMQSMSYKDSYDSLDHRQSFEEEHIHPAFSGPRKLDVAD